MHYQRLNQKGSRDSNKKGFTLIELLVVLAIIGFLAVILITVIDEARVKARNAGREQTVRQYMNALELYRNVYRTYPEYNAGAGWEDDSWACLGYTRFDPEGVCIDEPFEYADESLNEAIDEFLPGPPKDNYPLTVGPDSLAGIRYQCSDADCEGYRLTYYLENTKKCTVGVPNGTYGDHKRCLATLLESTPEEEED